MKSKILIKNYLFVPTILNISNFVEYNQNDKVMTAISVKEFNANQNMYFDLALSEDVRIKNDKFVVRLISEPINIIPEQVVLKPDDDFRSAITGDELMERMRVSIHKFFADKK